MHKNPHISVVTRTFNRPVMLERCFRSLQAALPDNAEWLIVDDAPDDKGCSEAKIDTFRSQVTWKIKYISSAQSHRTKALNLGLDKARGQYLHILDDDDTIKPSFYQKLSEFLDGSENSRWGAVACLCTRIDEREETPGTFVEIRRTPHYPELRAISFANLATTMTTPTCSLLFRRNVIDRMRFDESFTVAEDHEFLLRFLIEADIAVLPDALACFHYREGGQNSSSNSAITNQFEVEKARFQNALLRRDLRSGNIGLGWLVTLAEIGRGSTRTNVLLDRLYRKNFIKRMFRKIRK